MDATETEHEVEMDATETEHKFEMDATGTDHEDEIEKQRQQQQVGLPNIHFWS